MATKVAYVMLDSDEAVEDKFTFLDDGTDYNAYLCFSNEQYAELENADNIVFVRCNQDGTRTVERMYNTNGTKKHLRGVGVSRRWHDDEVQVEELWESSKPGRPDLEVHKPGEVLVKYHRRDKLFFRF